MITQQSPNVFSSHCNDHTCLHWVCLSTLQAGCDKWLLMACQQVEAVGRQGQAQAVPPTEAQLPMEALRPATTATARLPRRVLEEQQPPQMLASNVERLATGPVTAQVSVPTKLSCSACS